MLLLVAAGCFTAGYIHAASESSLDSLYESNQWFQLRDAVRSDKTAPAFYRGIVELAFHDWEQAERDLRAAADAAPKTVTVETVDQASQAALAMEALSDLYALAGRYKEAADQFDRFTRSVASLGLNQQTAQEASRSLKSYRALYSVLGRYVDQSIAERSYSQIPYSTSNGIPMVPVAIDGNQSKLMLDTGSNANFINPSEAKRLGLSVHSASVPLDAYDGAKEKTKGVAVANELTIGNFRLRNVAFYVLSEDDDDVPGLLGLPALYALGTVRWNAGGTLELGFPTERAEPNLAFHGGNLFAEAALGSNRLTLTVDTGADETLVYPSFARLLGKVDRDELAKRGVTLRVAGFDASLGAGMPVLSSRATGDFEGLDGNLGLDILGQAFPITFDFANMRLSVGAPGSSAPEPVTAATITSDPGISTLTAANLTDAQLGELLKSFFEDGTLSVEPPRDYVYTEATEIRFLDAKGNVIKSNTETHESIALYGERYERLTRKDGKALSSKEQREEQAKLDKETNKRKQEPAEAKAKRLAQTQKCYAEAFTALHFRLLGVENLNGRPAWKVETNPIPGESSDCGQTMAKSWHLNIWIDQADRKLAKWEGDNMGAVTWGGVLVRVPAGAMHISVDMARRDDGAWLPAHLRERFDAKLLLGKMAHGEVLSTYSDYRKFQSNSRLLQ